METNNSCSQHPVTPDLNCPGDDDKKRNSGKTIEISHLDDSIVCSKHQKLHSEVGDLNNILYDCN